MRKQEGTSLCLLGSHSFPVSLFIVLFVSFGVLLLPLAHLTTARDLFLKTGKKRGTYTQWF